MSQPSWLGQTIGGRYKIEALLGQGGMSAVYRGTDPNLRRTVAVKLIHPHLSSDPEFVRRFEQEAAAVAQLRHPNIIQVYDFNHDGEVYFMVLEYVPGETLQARLKALHAAGERLAVGEAVRIMGVVCEAVAYAHQRGMIHRDLKPANVMLNAEGEPILMDFGVAKMVGGQQHTATGAIIGTAAYMSPEQVRSERLDERADIYSLGVMLYEMAAGRPPFEGDSAMTVMFKHINEPPPDPRQFASDVPNELASVMDKALAKSPADRYQTAAEMAAALRRVTQRTAITPAATAISPPKPEAPVPQREPAPPPSQPSAPDQTVSTPAATRVAPPTSPAQRTTVGERGTSAPATSISVPARKAGAPVGLFVGLGAVGLIALIAILALLLPRLGSGGEATPVARATATVGGVAVVPSPTAPASTPTSPAPTLAPSATPEPTAEPTATPIPVPVGMLLVPGGEFSMGSENRSDEQPRHTVTLDGFFIDQFEVTNARYRACVDAGGCTPPGTSRFTNAAFAEFPVTLVTWEQAQAFCTWEGGKRLPTEAEWEFAARGGDGRRYPWGDNFDASLVPSGAPDVVQVGSFANASPFGASDMAGNVVEWVADWYSPTYYAESPGANPLGPASGSQKVMRGGSFGNPDGQFYTTTRRYQQSPTFRDVDIGFRCGADLP